MCNMITKKHVCWQVGTVLKIIKTHPPKSLTLFYVLVTSPQALMLGCSVRVAPVM